MYCLTRFAKNKSHLCMFNRVVYLGFSTIWGHYSSLTFHCMWHHMPYLLFPPDRPFWELTRGRALQLTLTRQNLQSQIALIISCACSKTVHAPSVSQCLSDSVTQFCDGQSIPLRGFHLWRPQNFWIFLPLPPCPHFHATFLISIPYFVYFSNAPSPQSSAHAHVINRW